MAVLCRTLAADIPIGALALFDRELRVRMAAGPRWEVGGFDTETMRGLHITEIVPESMHDQLLGHFATVLAGETVRFAISFTGDYRSTVIPVRADDGEIAGCLSLAWDEGAELRAERATAAELTLRLAQQSAVARLGEMALQRPSLDVLLDEACGAVRDGLGVDAAYMLERAGEPGMMRVRAACGFPPAFSGSEFEVRSFADPSGRELYAQGPVVIDDLPNDAGWRARPLREHGVVSSATVQLGRREAPTGLLGAHSFAKRSFSDRDLDFLTAVAHVLNGAIQGIRVEEQIRHDALHDALTGLPNRTLLLDRLRPALAGADREGRRIALFFLDVDNLKVLNDSLGHHAGDELLRAIGPRLRAVLRPHDMIARFGGDEFAVLCENVADESHALRVADRLVRAFAQPFQVGASRASARAAWASC